MMAANRNPRKIYVSNLSQDVRERDLGQLMEEVGRIERMQFKNRFAFIEFEKSQCCDDAVRKFDGIQFMGRRIRCEHYKYRGADRKYRSDNFSNDYRVFVCNLQPMTSWQDLKDFGRTAGQSVTFADVRPLRSGASRGARELEGIIEYSDRRDFDHALQELDGARLNGVRVKVFSKSSYDRSKFSEDDHGSKRRDVGPPRRGSRSRSRSKSRDRVGSRRANRRRSYSRSLSRSRSRNRRSGGRGNANGGRGSGDRGRQDRRPARRSASGSATRSRTRSRSNRSGSRHSRHSDSKREVNNAKNEDNKQDARSQSHSRSPSPEALKRQQLQTQPQLK